MNVAELSGFAVGLAFGVVACGVQNATPLDAAPSMPATSSPEHFTGNRAVVRGSTFFTRSERFNRYYTDVGYTPSRRVYVGAEATGDGSSRDKPMAVQQGLDALAAGDMIVFTRSAKPYSACYTVARGGTYDAPVVLYAERNDDGSRGVEIKCAGTENKNESCLNLMSPDYVAVDGFTLTGGSYGVRAEGKSYPASGHMVGLAVLNVDGRSSYRDPIFAAQTDWTVVQQNLGHGGGKRDGHGIYLSNGGDWSIARYNELWDNMSSTFQINADPEYVCSPDGTAFDDPECDGSALEGKGRGISEYVLVENNFFHDTLGPNFASVRNSIVRNNVSWVTGRHNASFYQETKNPKLGTSSNVVAHNLFVNLTVNHVVQFIEHSTNNHVVNNAFLSLTSAGSASGAGVVMQIDSTVDQNVYEGNVYVGGKLLGRTVGSNEYAEASLDPAWFAGWSLTPTLSGLVPVAGTPFAKKGNLLTEAPLDYFGVVRTSPVDIGPFSVR